MNKGRKIRYILITALSLLLMTGCKKGLPSISEVREVEGYSASEAMIFIATEKNRYENLYTDQIWTVQVDKDEMSIQDFLLSQVQVFLKDMKTMNLLAQERGIRLDSKEQELISRLSEAYFSGLTRADLDYMKTTLEDVNHMYEEYHLANKVVNELTKDIDLEISDNEAKVIDIQRIELNSQEQAREVYEMLQAEGVDFAETAKAHSANTAIDSSIGRGELPQEYEEEVFGLAAGEISGIIRNGENFTIVKCINDYNVDATQERKDELSKERKSRAFRQIYNRFQLDNHVVFNDPIWKQLNFTDENNTTTTNFFELYQEYFKDWNK